MCAVFSCLVCRREFTSFEVIGKLLVRLGLKVSAAKGDIYLDKNFDENDLREKRRTVFLFHKADYENMKQSFLKYFFSQFVSVNKIPESLISVG